MPYLKLRHVRRLNRWYGRNFQTMEGDWVLRDGWFYWVIRK